jgi:hypothetical protein
VFASDSEDENGWESGGEDENGWESGGEDENWYGWESEGGGNLDEEDENQDGWEDRGWENHDNVSDEEPDEELEPNPPEVEPEVEDYQGAQPWEIPFALREVVRPPAVN